MKKILLIISCCFIALTQQAQIELWGMTPNGGQHNAGVIYKTDTAGNQIIEYDFSQLEGENPRYSHLTEAANGKLYGVTLRGGTTNIGVLFEYDLSTNTYYKKIDFDGVNGSYPIGSLLKASDGMLYGMTLGGGQYSHGVIFQYDPINNIFTKKFDFNGASNGGDPYGSLIQATDGMLYGMNYLGGVNDVGVIFQYDPANNVYTKKIDFIGGSIGSRPQGSLLQASDGLLYGVTTEGGPDNAGVLFQYNHLTNISTTKFSFDYTTPIGAFPQGELIQATDGQLYGMTREGGTYNKGVLFQYDLVSSVYSKKIDFDGASSGSNPQGALLQTGDGNLYGTTVNGGVMNLGVLFQYNPVNSVCTKKIDFNGTLNGSNPSGSLMLASDGLLYGVSENGGVNEKGVIFQYDIGSNIYVKKQDLAFSLNGSYPNGALTNDSNGKLYGITSFGGVNGKGVLFQFNPLSHAYNKIIDFDSLNTGSFPIGTLLLASDGKLYGVTKMGGIYGAGTLFQFDPINNLITKKFDFNGSSDGKAPSGGLIQSSTGELYGMTTKGGSGNLGVIFQYNISTDIFAKKVDFTLTNSGTTKEGSLIEGTNGKIFGLASYGGIGFNGVLFMYDPITNTCVKKLDFSGIGSYPKSTLVLTSNGKLFGVTPHGGINSKGILFEYDVTNNVILKKLDFSNVNNEGAFGQLFEASDGKLYGITDVGTTGCGTLYQFDPGTNGYSKKIDFNNANGCAPYFSNVIEIPSIPTGINKNITPNNLFQYPNPNNGSFTIDITSKSQITITNVLGEVIFDQSLDTGKQNIDIQSQTNGIYFVTVTDAKGLCISKKIVIEK